MDAACFGEMLASSPSTFCNDARVAWDTLDNLLQQQVTCTGLSATIGCPSLAELHTARDKTQRTIGHALVDIRFRTLMNSCQDVDGIRGDIEQERLSSCAGRGASAAVQAFPTSYMSSIKNNCFRTGLQFRLGTIIEAIAHSKSTCRCNTANLSIRTRIANALASASTACLRGQHDMSCTSNPKQSRHERILRATKAGLAVVGIASNADQILATARGHSDTTCKVCPDLAVHDFHAGGDRRSLVDFTVTHPTNRTHMRSRPNVSRNAPGWAALTEEKRKVTKYRDQAERNHYHFIPFGVETYGAMGPSAQRFITNVMQHGDPNTSYVGGWSAANVGHGKPPVEGDPLGKVHGYLSVDGVPTVDLRFSVGQRVLANVGCDGENAPYHFGHVTQVRNKPHSSHALFVISCFSKLFLKPIVCVRLGASCGTNLHTGIASSCMPHIRFC